ncbi:VIT1/CCC1 transporter family protein [Mobiluncus porci]|uniref:Rubrerythrin family protein n=1 Tax=Mobiluncus porci TaxID=2652278 RepID=A0A7K0K5B2_9ACTO|nr:VIT1/CCC1 family protein [Mobiluncus porci]MST50629.1 rubrerythrin family protein [Mobiluncus porci]
MKTASTVLQPTPEQIKRWRHYLAEERAEARIYRELAKRRSGLDRDILLQIAKAEGRHEQYWLDRLGEHAEPTPKSAWHVRILQNLAIKIGSIFVLALMQRSEERGTYDLDADASPQMAADEYLHSEVVRALAAKSRARFSGKARAMIFGINDGLVSNLALVAGMAGSVSSRGIILLTGFTGLVAGALSMGAGEYISITSQRELLESSLPNPKMRERLPMLDRAANELQLLFLARGEDDETAAAHAALILESINSQQDFSALDDDSRRVSDTDTQDLNNPTNCNDSLISESETLQETLKSESDPTPEISESATVPLEAIGSGIQAGSFSFGAFSLGALVPILPFIFGLASWVGIIVATALVGLILLFIGGVMGILSGKPPFLRALRQAAIGIGAAIVTYLLGTLASGVQFL